MNFQFTHSGLQHHGLIGLIQASEVLKKDLDGYNFTFKKLLEIDKLRNYSDDHLVNLSICKNENDRTTKMRDNAFYEGNLQMLNQTAFKYFNEQNIEKLKQINPNRELFIGSQFSQLGQLGNHMRMLHHDFREHVKNEGPALKQKGKNKFWERSHSSESSIYSDSLVFLYGQDHGDQYMPLDFNSAIFTMRAGIEQKIRNLFGANFLKNSHGTIKPIPFSNILTSLKKVESEITFPIPIDNLIRINNWFNYFVHDGKRSYFWNYTFVYTYLSSIFTNDNIQITKAGLSEFHNQIMTGGFDLYGRKNVKII